MMDIVGYEVVTKAGSAMFCAEQRNRAEQYAVDHHGTIHELVRRTTLKELDEPLWDTRDYGDTPKAAPPPAAPEMGPTWTTAAAQAACTVGSGTKFAFNE